MHLVHKQQLSPLQRAFWSFYFDERDHALYVDDYRVEERKSLRHNWKTVAMYLRLGPTPGGVRRILEKDVPLTPAVKMAALDGFVGPLRVELWSNRQR